MKFTRCFNLFSFGTCLLLAIASSLLAQSRNDGIPSVAVAPDTLPPSLQNAVHIMVELNDAPAGITWAAAYKQAQAQLDAQRNYALQHPNLRTSAAFLKQAPTQAKISSTQAKQVQSIAQRNDQTQRALLPSLTGGDIAGKVIYRAQIAYNGIAMVVSPDKVAAIAKMQGVKAVHPISPKTLVNTFSDIDFLNTRPAWTTGFFGNHGENIKVADIDTGLDYIHRDFGGSGAGADYTSTTDTSAVPNANYPTPKIPGGTDLVGDAYDANTNPIPVPDNNPLDCAGHGTATASLIAGFGETNAGFTYSGTYDAANPDVTTLKIPPGIAPNAKLYPVRVFGCGGSTDVVTQAIEWAMTAGTGNPANRVDVINMSLGANHGFADDADDVAATIASSVGILVCSAAGNAGDSYYIHSSPAAASGTMSVAATYNNQNGYIFDSTLTVNAPPADAGQQDFTIFTTTSPHSSVTGNIVYAINPPGPTGSTHDGSSPLTNAAQVSGNICVVDRVPGQGANASVNCQNAGAIGIIDKADLSGAGGNPFLLSTSPLLTRPMVVCSKAFGDNLETEAAFDGNGVSTAGVNVTIAPGNGSVVQPANPPGSAAGTGSPDTIPSYSSRGPRLPDNATKPDIAAPAEVTAVAVSAAERPVDAFSGNAVSNFNGTSSATPHVAGMMALLRQLHPSWSVQETLALACNTATHDLFTTVGGVGGSQIGVGRIGAGRIDIGLAAAATVVAYNGSDPNLIGVSFGVVEVPVDGSTVLTKNITVTNKGATNVTYNTSLVNNPAVSGATFTVSPANFTVNAGTSTNVTVTFTATGSTLRHVREASVAPTQGGTTPTNGNPRQWLTEAGGYAVLTPTDSSPTLRVEVYAAPKPASSMHATSSGFVPTAPNTGSFTINLSGSPVNNVTSNANSGDVLALVKAFEAQYASPSAGQPNAPTDRNRIKYVGITSDYVTRAPTTAARIVWGIEGFGAAADQYSGSSDREIFLDTGDGAGGPPDGIPDFAIFLARVGTGQENVYVPALAKLHAGTAATGGFFTNGLNASVADTNAYNNSCVTVPFAASSIVDTANGYPALATAGHTLFQYQVVTFDRNGNEVEETPVLTYDLANPGLEVENSAVVAQTVFSSTNDHVENFMYKDLPTNVIPVNYNGTNFQANGSLGVLLFHMLNADGNRADLVAFRKPTVTGFSPSHGPIGTNVTITGSNFNSGTGVKFFNNKTASVTVLTSNTLIATVPAGAVTGPIKVFNAAGSSTAPGNFTIP